MRTTTRIPVQRPVVSAFLGAFVIAHGIAAWTYANGDTWPFVGSAMFAASEAKSVEELRIPHVVVRTPRGPTGVDQTTFGVEPFEWRKWLSRTMLSDDAGRVRGGAEALAEAYAAETDLVVTAVELWMKHPDRPLEPDEMVFEVKL